MNDLPGVRPPRISELVRAQDRLSFIYLERATVHRDANAITATDERGVVHIPAATLGALLLGPGTRVTHQAMMLLAESGSTAVWVGERGVRYYAHGRSLARTSRLLEAQAAAVSNQTARLAVARAMYAMRFPGEDVSALSMQQLRGREGARVRRLYREHAERTGIDWKRRSFDPNDYTASDAVNQALSAATTCLYGIVHAVVVALGCSPGLGFVHTGHERSFVFDIADLYKAEFAIPVAFDVVAEATDDIPSVTRRSVRDTVYAGNCSNDAAEISMRCCFPTIPRPATSGTPTSSNCGTAKVMSLPVSRTTTRKFRGSPRPQCLPGRPAWSPHQMVARDQSRCIRWNPHYPRPRPGLATCRRTVERRARHHDLLHPLGTKTGVQGAPPRVGTRRNRRCPPHPPTAPRKPEDRGPSSGLEQGQPIQEGWPQPTDPTGN